MTKHAWRSISTVHFDPEKEEQIKWMKIEIENQLKRTVKLVKNLNHGNKERNLRNKSEAINLVEDFQKQYESLYALYEDLREQVKKNIGFGDGESGSSSTSSSDSESYYSPGGSSQTPHRRSSSKDSSFSSDVNQESDPTWDLEDTILKDKLTSSSEVKTITNQYSHSEVLKDLSVQGDGQENVGSEKMGRIRDLEGQVESLKLEISGLCMEKEELKEVVACKSDEAMQMKEEVERLKLEISGVLMEKECLRKQSDDAIQMKVESLKLEISGLCMEKERLKEQVECKSDEAMQMKEKLSSLKAQVLEADAKLKENESRFCSVKQSVDSEQKYLLRISDLEAQAKNKKFNANLG
ncbi:COP1-interactive protein 1 [Striga hermonthica]|uniref:COP1-interactive protein 1 n=1 Tax=Striga hermonthica TaxID=68872 RepID=A0A9N7MPZ0_STRHE|nr:COP1-interactive protein 1 [Striga hermonthica]